MDIDRTLAVLRARAVFDLGEAGRSFAAATQACADREMVVQRCEAAVAASRDELARLAQAGPLNPATWVAVRRMHATGQARSGEAREALAAANATLQQERAELARLRQLESGLGKAVDRVALEARRLRQGHDEAAVDDLWLQNSWRAGS